MSRLIRYKNFASYVIYKYVLPAYGFVCVLFFLLCLTGSSQKKSFYWVLWQLPGSMSMTLLKTPTDGGYGDWSGHQPGKASSGWTGTPVQPHTLQTTACLACLGWRSSELVRVVGGQAMIGLTWDVRQKRKLMANTPWMARYQRLDIPESQDRTKHN